KDAKVHRLTFDRFRELSLQGSRAPLDVVPYVLDGTNAADVAGKIQARKPRLVFAIGTNATQLANEKLREFPIVYSMVLNPAKHDLTRGNLCGISLEISPKEQLASFTKLKPSLKRVAVIYDPATSDNVIEEADAFARASGFELVRKKAQNIKD